MKDKTNKKDRITAPTLDSCAKAVAKVLEQQTDPVADRIVKLDEELRAEHRQELEDCRKQSDGQMPQLWVHLKILGVDERTWDVANPLWAVDTDEVGSFDSDWIEHDGFVKRSSKGGDYCRQDFERALPKLAKWEIRLIWKYERRVQVLRAYLRDFESIASQLLCLTYLPTLDCLRRADDDGRPQW